MVKGKSAVIKRRSLLYASALSAVVVGAAALPSVALESIEFQVRDSDTALREQLLAASQVQAAQRDGVSAPRDIMAAALADYARLSQALYANGYYGGVIHILVDGREAASIPAFSVPSQISEVSIDIDPGPPFQFDTADIAPLAPGTRLPADFRPEAPARSALIQQAVDVAVKEWRDAGHAKVTLLGQSVSANHADQTLSAILRLDPGPQVRFGKLHQTNASAVRSARIRRIAGLPSGEVFSPEVLAKVAGRLRRTGAFSSVSLSEAPVLGPNDTMDIDLALVDAKPRRFGFGAELSSLEGLTLSGFWLHRNLLGGAERFLVDGEVAGIGGESGGTDYRLGARIEQPATFGTDTKAFIFANAAYEDEPGYLSRQVGLGAGASKIFSDSFEAELGVALRYSDTKDSFGDRTFFLLTVPAAATWDHRDDPSNPAKGFYLKGEAMPFVGLRGAGAGLRFHADGRVYRGFGQDDRFVLAGRMQVGAVFGSDVAELPPDYLFFSGGGNTVRGQPYKSLGIDLSGGGFIGGKAFLGVSAELRAQVTENIGVVGFVDAGHIGADEFFDSAGGWHAGAGLGLRYQTGIGPIRLDVAAPVSGATGDGVQVYIGIGQAF